MIELLQVNQQNLDSLSKQIGVPEYDRTHLKTGIVHIGVGGFHRAHQGFYTDALLSQGKAVDWAICGICLLERDRKMYDVLKAQDGLYTLLVKDNTLAVPPQILGAITAYYFAPETPDKVIQKMADPVTRIISLTITEGGYNFDAATGAFKMDSPDIQSDLNHPEAPKTVFGYLAAALRRRMQQHLPLTILSCDNIQQNGTVAQRMLGAYMQVAAPDVLDWMAANVSFPNCMVDRITPITTAEDRDGLQQRYGVLDEWPVASEAFHQWVIEDDFKAGRPAWEQVGAQFVADVDPYEKMKIGLINGGHSLVGLTGCLADYSYIDEVIEDPLFSALLRQYMEREVTPVLDPVAGVDLSAYKNQVIHRFGNSTIKDSVGRIILESSAKIPKFILPTLKANLERGGPIRICTTVVACWYQYLANALLQGRFDQVEDQMRTDLLEWVRIGQVESPLAFLNQAALFGTLSQSERFSSAFLQILEKLQQKGVRKVVQDELDHPEGESCV